MQISHFQRKTRAEIEWIEIPSLKNSKIHELVNFSRQKHTIFQALIKQAINNRKLPTKQQWKHICNHFNLTPYWFNPQNTTNKPLHQRLNTNVNISWMVLPTRAHSVIYSSMNKQEIFVKDDRREEKLFSKKKLPSLNASNWISFLINLNQILDKGKFHFFDTFFNSMGSFSPFQSIIQRSWCWAFQFNEKSFSFSGKLPTQKVEERKKLF